MNGSFGLSGDLIRSSVLRIRPELDGQHEAALDLFARAAFGTLVEPADRVATMLIGALGAAEALSAVIERRSAESVIDAIAAEAQLAADESVGPAEKRLTAELSEAFARWTPRLSSASVLGALAAAAHVGARVVAPWDEDWPHGLNDLQQHAPLLLWVRGRAEALAAMQRSLALVGARAATGYGEYLAVEAAAGAVDRGLAVVSGGAYGIDGAAHRSALASGGHTVAFMAGGVDRLYPAGHEALLSRIATEGALVSELPCGSSPSKWRFLQRNRLIAACGTATVVLEAGRRSGAINTAGHAAQLGRPLGAAPGPVTSAASAGCHRLIREFGAVCVTSPAEMAELVGEQDAGMLPGAVPEQSDAASKPDSSGHGGAGVGSRDPQQLDAASRIRAVLRPRAARSVASLAAATGLSLAEVHAQLGLLELAGEVGEREKGWVLTQADRR